MSINIVVCAKQVVDPETPASAFRIDSDAKRVLPAAGIPPVVNGFDENAVEAALQLKETVGASVAVLSVGSGFVMDVMKKPLSMGADRLVLVDGPAGCRPRLLRHRARPRRVRQEARRVRPSAVRKAGVRTGTTPWPRSAWRRCSASPCVTLAQKIEVEDDGGIVVQRALTDGYEVVRATLPRSSPSATSLASRDTPHSEAS